MSDLSSIVYDLSVQRPTAPHQRCDRPACSSSCRVRAPHAYGPSCRHRRLSCHRSRHHRLPPHTHQQRSTPQTAHYPPCHAGEQPRRTYRDPDCQPHRHRNPWLLSYSFKSSSDQTSQACSDGSTQPPRL